MVKLVLLTSIYNLFDEMPRELKSTKTQNNLPGMLPFSLNLLPHVQHLRVLGESESSEREREREREKLGFLAIGLRWWNCLLYSHHTSPSNHWEL